MKKWVIPTILLIAFAVKVLSQTFGGFASDQPFFAKDASAAASYDPASISGMVLWVAADYLTYTNNNGTGQTIADGNRVHYWTDRSPVGNHLTNFTADIDYLVGWWRTNKLNGKPVIENGAQRGAGAVSYAQTNWLFGVVYVVAGSGNSFFFNGATANNPNFVATTGTQVYAQSGGAPALYGAVNTNTWAIVAVKYAGAGSIIRTNGVQASAGSIGTTAITAITIGGDWPMINVIYTFKGFQAEWLLYNADLTSNSVYIVEHYLANKYNLTVAP